MYKRVIDHTWSFRNSNTKEYTHCYHTYPAMMIPMIARALLNKYSPKRGIKLLFDPYMGSGTSLVEASIKGIDAIGTDLNPLARLISKVKTTHYNEEKIQTYFTLIQSQLLEYKEGYVKNRNFDNISNYKYWYSQDSLLRLSYLSQIIKDFVDHEHADFFYTILSEVVREVSFTRNSEFKRFRMPENKLNAFTPNTFNLFEEKSLRNIKGLKEFNKIHSKSKINIYDFDSCLPIPNSIIKPDSVDMVITSPPYGDSKTTVAYGQFSRWANEWFNFEHAKDLDKILMGGKKQTDENFTTHTIRKELNEIKSLDTKRYLEVISFLNDYNNSIFHVSKVMKQGGIVCYVVGNRTVKGIQIPLDYFTAEMFETNGFRHINTIVREIPNKRMPLKTSPTNKKGEKTNTMNNEYIVILEKI